MNGSLHVAYALTDDVRARIARWDREARREPTRGALSWQLAALWSQARSATVAASTAIEGNPLTDEQVDAVLAGRRVEAEQPSIREVTNYNAAMNLVARAAERGAPWSEDLIQSVNAAVTAGLPVDTGGGYRADAVRVGIYSAPSELVVPGLMAELVRWLNEQATESGLVRSALAHLNLIAIHPFEDGNGRTARVLSSFALMIDGVRVPEIITIETYLRAHRGEYIDALRTALGTSYVPEDHQATPWLDYYTRISIDRLDARERLLAALPNDFGLLLIALQEAGEPVEWIPILLSVAVAPTRTSDLARSLGVAPVTMRATLGRLADAGWVTATGRTRARRYEPAPRLLAVPLRVPTIWRWMRSGQQELWPGLDGSG